MLPAQRNKVDISVSSFAFSQWAARVWKGKGPGCGGASDELAKGISDRDGLNEMVGSGHLPFRERSRLHAFLTYSQDAGPTAS